jgi:tetrahydromethanopterin S-methyltransferase subunit E
MRAFNLIALTLALVILSVMGLSILAEYLLGTETAKFVVLPFAMIIGFSGRRITQKILGYTLDEAMKDGASNDLQD